MRASRSKRRARSEVFPASPLAGLMVLTTTQAARPIRAGAGGEPDAAHAAIGEVRERGPGPEWRLVLGGQQRDQPPRDVRADALGGGQPGAQGGGGGDGARSRA